MTFYGAMRYGYGADNVLSQLASMEIERDSITFYTLGGKIFLKKEQVARISKWLRFFPVGITVDHTASDQPDLLNFWTFRTRSIKRYCKENGYPFPEPSELL